MKGYKVFNKYWTCHGFQYEVGKTYKHTGELKVCGSGFHFCQKLSDCFSYYPFDSKNKVAEIEAVGKVLTADDKSVTDEIKIVKELTWNEVLDLCNTGDHNTGICNTGNHNTGNFNVGSCNIGNFNAGSRNIGFCNIGDRNIADFNAGNDNIGVWNTGNCNMGKFNTGNHNTGICNTGDFNTGDCNSGDWNSANYSTGFFNTQEQPVYAFNKPLEITRGEFLDYSIIRKMRLIFTLTQWIGCDEMTSFEKKQHPEYETTDGYLKQYDFKTACSNMWDMLTDEDKKEVWNIPNFDPDIFEDITGIHVEKDNKDELLKEEQMNCAVVACVSGIPDDEVCLPNHVSGKKVILYSDPCCEKGIEVTVNNNIDILPAYLTMYACIMSYNTAVELGIGDGFDTVYWIDKEEED